MSSFVTFSPLILSLISLFCRLIGPKVLKVDKVGDLGRKKQKVMKRAVLTVLTLLHSKTVMLLAGVDPKVDGQRVKKCR